MAFGEVGHDQGVEPFGRAYEVDAAGGLGDAGVVQNVRSLSRRCGR